MANTLSSMLLPEERIITEDVYHTSPQGFKVKTCTQQSIVKVQYKQCDCCGANGELNIECEYCGQIIIKN